MQFGKLPDGRRRIACEARGHIRTRVRLLQPKTIAEQRAAFEQSHRIIPRRHEPVETLKVTFLVRNRNLGDGTY